MKINQGNILPLYKNNYNNSCRYIYQVYYIYWINTLFIMEDKKTNIVYITVTTLMGSFSRLYGGLISSMCCAYFTHHLLVASSINYA